jgi:hypothetical protein
MVIPVNTVTDKKSIGQVFFANVNLLALSMVTMKIFVYLLYLVTPVYSTQFWLNFLIRLVLLFFCPRLYVCTIGSIKSGTNFCRF